MALNAYLRLKGQKQGEIKGGVTQKGREGAILVIAADHEVATPRDAATGRAAGRRVHSPFVINKTLDRSSPLLYNALVTNEIISEWELQFFAPAATGAEVQRYTVKLTNAIVTDIKFHLPNTQDPDLAKYSEYEEVAFTYQRIMWTWIDGGITAQDDVTIP
jgi:type VI secretion system secreted protein Hcp